MTGHIVVCLDKFRGSATAPQACGWLADGIRPAGTGREVVELPIADGGEGTVDALVAAGYRRATATVTGPLGDPVTATLAVRGDRAVIELAQASGLHLVPDGERSPLTATTYGTGELIRTALDLGCRDIVLAVGGSAGTDGGAGMLQALGVRITTADGAEVDPGGAALAEAARVDLDGLDPRLRDSRLTLVCDVDNALLGPHGAAAIFGPQKGAGPEDVELLEKGLGRFAALLTILTGDDHTQRPGAGAAGGTGFAALAVLGARQMAGTHFLLGELGLERRLRGAALAVVGEGALDSQSRRGRAPMGAAARAGAAGVPVVAVAGRVEVAENDLAAHGIRHAYSLLARAGALTAAMSGTPGLLGEVGREIAQRLGPATVLDLGFARLDLGREQRQGLPEVVYGPGKTAAQITAIVTGLLNHNTGPVLVTRVAPEMAAAVRAQVDGGRYDVRAQVDGGRYDAEARLLVWRPADTGDFAVTVVAAGTSDRPTASEAHAVATALGLDVTAVHDVGVAGLDRILQVRAELQASDAVIVIAGMEGALASVVGGLVRCPVIAVPTSTGYGASLEGVTALLAMHASCAAGITVVNIDSGFGAAMAAHRIAQHRTAQHRIAQHRIAQHRIAQHRGRTDADLGAAGVLP
jgi:glycerate kinase